MHRYMATKKEQWAEAIRKKHPDKAYEDEDEMYGDAMDGYDEVKGRMSKFEEDDKKLMELLQKYPEVMNFISTLTSTGDFAEAYAELPDYALMDDEERERYKKSQDGKRAERERMAEMDRKKQENVEKSAKVLEEWAKKNGLTEEQVAQFIETIISKIADKLNSGEFDEEFFETLFRVMNYDKDVTASHEAGVIDGRNQAIAEKAKRRRANDGLPETMSGGGEQRGGETGGADANLKSALRQSLDRNAIHRFNQ